jgi:hypothetical protein
MNPRFNPKSILVSLFFNDLRCPICPSYSCKLLKAVNIPALTRKRSIARSKLDIGSLLDVSRTAWAGPTQPALKPVKSLSHFCRKYRPEGRFCRLCRFITTAPSIIYVSGHFMAWKRSSVRSRSGPPINHLYSKSYCNSLSRSYSEITLLEAESTYRESNSGTSFFSHTLACLNQPRAK